MRTYFKFSVLMVLLMTLCLSFSSCSKDDDEDKNGSNDTSTSVDISIDSEKMPTDEDSNFFTYGHYTIPSKYMNIDIMFKQFYAPFSHLILDFDLVDLNSIKKGDDITKYSNFGIILLENMNQTKLNSGNITVTNFDSKNKVLSLEFTNVSVTNESIGSTNKKNHVINGKVTLRIEVD